MSAATMIILLCLAQPTTNQIDRAQADALDEGAIEVSGDEHNHDEEMSR